MNTRVIGGILLLLLALAIAYASTRDAMPPASTRDAMPPASTRDAMPPASALQCVPATCCHATECVSASEAPLCADILCTQECVPGTLDCGQASCQPIAQKCVVVPHA